MTEAIIIVIIENILSIVTALVLTLIGVAGAWLTAKIGKKEELATINQAQQEVFRMAQITVGELQQTIVDKLKENGAKLDDAQIKALNETLIEKTLEKMAAPTVNLLNAAGVDVVALITGVGEDWINAMKKD